MRRAWLIGAGVSALLVLALWAARDERSGEAGAPVNSAAGGLALLELMGEQTTDANAAAYPQARQGMALGFPQDHAAHPGYRHEWWYLTGHLEGEGGARFGFQLTLFRLAQRPPGATRVDNPWLDGQVYLGHLGITRIDQPGHRSAQRLSRAGPGLAGAELAPVRVWLEDWVLKSEAPQSLFPLRLQAAAAESGIALELRLDSLKPRVLQGERGWSRKNAEGGASYYYSYPRLEARGRLTWQARDYRVTGSAWYDHEWGSNSLAPYQAGWDWFALQLEDGRELMLYRLRNRDQRPEWRQALLVLADGSSRVLDDWSLEETAHWLSPSGRRYPAGWRVRVPQAALDLRVRPLVADQEMRLLVQYWEGAVAVTGSHAGRGYVELAGYPRLE